MSVGGKTVIASSIMQDSIKKGKIIWFIVHRSELLAQANDTLDRYEISKENIRVYMVQSLVYKLNKITEKPDMIIFDECQHSSSTTYKKIIDKFPNSFILGLSATPTRLTGKPLGDVYETIVSGITTKQLIKMKYLADYDYYAPSLNIDLDEVKINKGDYEKKEIDDKMNKPAIYGDILKNYKKIADGKKTIIYCNSIKYSKKIEKLFAENGYKIKHFDGKTSEKERNQIVEDFRNNKIQMLTNVDLIGEGFDVPDCECVLLLRPTQSLNIFIQSSTRCLRPNGDKKAIIIDYVNNFERHGLPDEEREWTLNGKIKKRNSFDNEGNLVIKNCQKCYKTFKGNLKFCPYCGFENIPTKKEIENKKEIELKKIEEQEAIKRKEEQYKRKTDVYNCKTMSELIAYGKSKGYKNAGFWASQIMQARKRKLKK